VLFGAVLAVVLAVAAFAAADHLGPTGHMGAFCEGMQREQMWLGLLGPLAVRLGAQHVEVPAAKQRVVLAVLALRAGQVVPGDELVEFVWGGNAPRSADGSIRNYIWCLRVLLGDAGGRIVTQSPGYRLDAGADELDVLAFRQLCGDGAALARAGSWHRTVDVLGEALALWRGTPLGDVPCEMLQRDWVPQLAEERLRATEQRIGAQLELGRHSEVLAGLEQMAAEHPLRERVQELLMMALYRSGHPAEALAAFRRLRQMLAAELGVEPGGHLQRLHQRMLARDPALASRPEASPVPVQRVTPRQLPAAVAGFTGRTAELNALTRILDQAGAASPGTVVICVIGGTAGVGKTALALHFAHQAAGRFPDGQLHANLRGFAPSGTAATPAEAVRGFLDALGVPPGRIPPGADAQAALYRSLLAGKRMLIVLDNAHDEDQVRPLLPASPASLVIVTSRNQLAGLAAADGARLLGLDVLSPDAAAQLLTARIGEDRAAAEPGVVDEIAALCARLPLALAIAAARAATRPRLPLSALAAELRGAPGRLDALDAGEEAGSVTAVFSWSYSQLSRAAARMFRLLGLHPGPDISLRAAASLAAAGEPRARRLLSELTRGCLLTEHAPGRYAFHDLLRAYAATQARDCDPEPGHHAAAGRILDHYLHTASHSRTLLRRPEQEPLALAPPAPGTRPERPADHRQALAWFTAEHHVLLATVTLAAQTGTDRRAWQLPCAMAEYFRRRGYPHEHRTVMTSALAAATRLDDTPGQAMSLRRLGMACYSTGDYDQARDHLNHCLPLYQQLGDRQGEALTQHNLSLVAEAEGRDADGLGHAEQALRLFRAIGHEAAHAEVLGNAAWLHARLGGYQQARTLCEQALAVTARLGAGSPEPAIQDTLGYIEYHLGNLAQATAHFETALALSRDISDALMEAWILTHLGDARQTAGELPHARQAWQQALAIYDNLQHPDAEKIRTKLTTTQVPVPNPRH
jgi:DNA-binding SARP family transcriptional activator/tetratricopeptide (TPR) repeat protein